MTKKNILDKQFNQFKNCTCIAPCNCAVKERTADGVSVGRCWFHTNEEGGRLICPRHGDVTTIQERFKQTGELGEDPR